MLGEVADRAARTQRHRRNRWLHRVADTPRRSDQLVGPVVGLEVDPPAHPDFARAPQHDRGLGVIGIEVLVGPTQEAALERYVGIGR